MSSTHLHCDEPIVDQYLFGKEVGAYCRLVAGAELLVDLSCACEPTYVSFGVHACTGAARMLRGPYILIHQARFAYPTVSKDDDLLCVNIWTTTLARSCSTLRRTFFLDAMV
jgi:hypothetical protein